MASAEWNCPPCTAQARPCPDRSETTSMDKLHVHRHIGAHRVRLTLVAELNLPPVPKEFNGGVSVGGRTEQLIHAIRPDHPQPRLIEHRRLPRRYELRRVVVLKFFGRINAPSDHIRHCPSASEVHQAADVRIVLDLLLAQIRPAPRIASMRLASKLDDFSGVSSSPGYVDQRAGVGPTPSRLVVRALPRHDLALLAGDAPHDRTPGGPKPSERLRCSRRQWWRAGFAFAAITCV